MEIRLNALTPIWTGGVGGTPDRLYESGIIGSLRWWYEAVVRGVGGYACAHSCELSARQKTGEERRANLCPACYLFGCGGWKRRFRLVASAEKMERFQLATLDKTPLATRNKSKKGVRGGGNRWWLNEIFPESGGADLPSGEVTLSFRHVADAGVREQIVSLLSIMAHIGAIGAKTQYGFGQFEWGDKRPLEESVRTIRGFVEGMGFMSAQNQRDWYSLAQFWFYELDLPPENKQVKRFRSAKVLYGDSLPENYLPVSFDIRYKLPGSSAGGLRLAYCESRKELAKSEAERQTQMIFGPAANEKDRRGSRVFVSHLFKRDPRDENYRLRDWGFTDEAVGNVVGKEHEKMFKLDETPRMMTGREIVGGRL